MHDLAELHTTTELIALAKARLPAPAWDFIVGGAETETTILRNRYALDGIAFRPRVLRNVADANPATTFLGAPRRLPVLLAPLASLTDIDPQGALPIARAAAEFGCLMLVSSVAQPDFEPIARAAGEQFIFQLYADGDDRWVLDTAKRAAAAGAKALCLTVDVPTFGRRERGLHRRQAIAGRPFGQLRSGEAHRGRAGWPLVDKLERALDVPLMIKGIETAEDAELALQHGVEVIYVSNHGGRQLDHGRGAIDLLPEVASTARGKAEIVIDGGFMRGTDILKAVAKGAAMVGLGRLQALALGAAGERGIVRMLELIEQELVVAMQLLGVNRCTDLDGTYLQPAAPVTTPGTLSAFPCSTRPARGSIERGRQPMKRSLSRREVLKRAAAVGAASAVPAHVLTQRAAQEPYANLRAAEAQTLEAIVARLIPSDANGPGALEAGAARYIDRALGDALAASRNAYTSGLAALDAYSQSSAGKRFAELEPSRQDAVLRDLERNVATGFTPSAAAFFELVLGHTLEGTFSDPRYGGNRDFVGWELLGYPGLRLAVAAEEQRMTAELRMNRVSAYDLPMFETDAHGDDHDR